MSDRGSEGRIGHGRLTDTEANVAGLGAEMRWLEREPARTVVDFSTAAYGLEDEERDDEEETGAAAAVEEDELEDEVEESGGRGGRRTSATCPTSPSTENDAVDE